MVEEASKGVPVLGKAALVIVGGRPLAALRSLQVVLEKQARNIRVLVRLAGPVLQELLRTSRTAALPGVAQFCEDLSLPTSRLRETERRGAPGNTPEGGRFTIIDGDTHTVCNSRGVRGSGWGRNI